MKRFGTVALMMISCCALNSAGARLEIQASANPPCVFSGANREIPVVLRNTGSINFDESIRACVFQTSSAMAVSLSEVPWKKLQILPSQTVLETAHLDFPSVTAETRFLVQWLDHTNHVIGATMILVYPTNLFQTLRTLLCETNFGVLDPGSQLKPLLKAQGISFTDLSGMNLDDFSGRLALIGPFQSPDQEPAGLAGRIKTIAKKNVAVVWIRPPSPSSPLAPLGWERKKIQPSYYYVQKDQSAIVVVQSDLVAGLAEHPQSQIALIYLCRLALNPQPAAWPDLSSQP